MRTDIKISPSKLYSCADDVYVLLATVSMIQHGLNQVVPYSPTHIQHRNIYQCHRLHQRVEATYF
jgi:hypothetical protein